MAEVDRLAHRQAQRLHRIGDAMNRTTPATRPLGPDGQRPRRRLERRLRRRALALARWARRYGIARQDAAGCVGLRPGTLGRWDRGRRRFDAPEVARGRPRRLADPITRLDVTQHLEILGPGRGLPVLRALFPDVARSQLRELQEAYRGRWLDQHGLWTEVLHWTAPGAVWAADFSDPPSPVDGVFDHVLAARDLASFLQLAATPTRRADADTAAALAEALFIEHGAPLVFKIDNGSPFIAEVFQALLDRWQVYPLLSPPRLPRYNGAVEAGNGSVKTRTGEEAARYGRTGYWTVDDLEAARLQANATARPWGDCGPTPQQAWGGRTPISTAQRHAFLQCVVEQQKRVRTELELPCEGPLGRRDRAIVARAAARRALQALGYLQVRRRRITPPFNSPLRAKIH